MMYDGTLRTLRRSLKAPRTLDPLNLGPGICALENTTVGALLTPVRRKNKPSS